jgi:hypothetical protein
MAATAKYECKHCDSRFKSAQRLVDHEVICRIIVDPTAKQETPDPLIETLETEPQAALKIIKHLVKRITAMEKDLINLKAHLAIKIDTLEWLNKSVVPPQNPQYTFSAFMTAIVTIAPAEFDLLFENLRQQTFAEWLKHVINKNVAAYTQHIPAYTQRPIFVVASTTTKTETHRVFYYHISNDDAVPLWKEAPDDIFETIWFHMCKGIVKALGEWRREQTRLSETDENAYQTTLLKVIDTNKEKAYIRDMRAILLKRLQHSSVTYELN